jgi:uncharacterized DUF497 family protein
MEQLMANYMLLETKSNYGSFILFLWHIVLQLLLSMNVGNLIWDDWNTDHLKKHSVSREEVEEVCLGRHSAKESYRGRLIIKGKTKNGRLLIIVLSPENRNLQPYKNDEYYVITAFEEE